LITQGDVGSRLVEARSWLIGQTRVAKRAILMANDLLLLSVAVWLAFSVRLAQAYVPPNLPLWMVLASAPVAGVLVFQALGLYRLVTRFLGYRKGQELVSLFKSSDVVCVPSRNEPFGIVILEAWSATKPVVATNIGGPKEFVHHRYNGLTSDQVGAQISDTVNMLIHDRDQAQEMGRNGRREVVNKFSWEGAAIATESVYRSLMLEGAYHGAESEDFEMAKRNNGNGATGGKTAVTKPRTATVLETLSSIEPTQDEIKARAFQIYLARNGRPGDSNSDWLQAERELRAEKSKATTRRAGK